jgi:hypothetical protein
VAYRIINNTLYIAAGETATYDVKVINRSTGAPYILPVDKNNNIIISFVVKPSVYSSSSESVLKKYIVVSNELKLDTNKIYDYDESDWNNDFIFGETKPAVKAVYRKLSLDGKSYEYRYYDAAAENDGTDDYMWKPYEFRISFPFYHEDTIGLQPKQYKYEIALYAGPNLEIVGDEKKSLQKFDYKEVLLSPTDFIVEGTLSE